MINMIFLYISCQNTAGQVISICGETGILPQSLAVYSGLNTYIK